MARARITGVGLNVPALVDLEFMSALRGLARSGRVSEAGAEWALASLRRAPLVRQPVESLTRRIWELRRNVTPYDAAYVALAEHLGVVFVTADRRLASAPGTRCEFDVLEV